MEKLVHKEKREKRELVENQDKMVKMVLDSRASQEGEALREKQVPLKLYQEPMEKLVHKEKREKRVIPVCQERMVKMVKTATMEKQVPLKLYQEPMEKLV